MLSAVVTLFRRVLSGKASAARAIAEDSKRSFWAFVDQGLVSVGNFGVNIVLARFFAHHQQLGDFGAFWVLMELMFFLNGVQGAMLVYPLTVRGAALDGAALGKMATESLVLTTLSAPILILCLSLTAFISHISLAAGIWAGIALLLWQLQETTRRTLMTHLHFRAACLGDAVSYVGQFAAVAWLASRGTLSLPTCFQAIAITSAAACLIQVFQIGLRRTNQASISRFARDCWSIGRWILFGNLTNVFSGALFNWNLAYWAGLETLGIYQALVNLIRPANPLGFAVATLITPNAAKALQSEGLTRARNVAMRFSILGAVLLAPYLALLLMFPKLSLAILYGWDSPYQQYATLVQICAVAVGLMYVGMASGAFLNGIERVRESFIGQVTYAGAYLFIVMPMSALFGLSGAVLGWLTAGAFRVAVQLYFAGLYSDDPPSVGSEAVSV